MLIEWDFSSLYADRAIAVLELTLTCEWSQLNRGSFLRTLQGIFYNAPILRGRVSIFQGNFQ
ncbi:MAG: hypothetical protein OJF51_001591 [Nitrospira sp.]|jgi:hypothetical protein|nr:MAG: hypothetical protein OJF51_001591 [Nitrospira sp.]